MNSLQRKDEVETIEVLPEDIPVTMPELQPRLVLDTMQQFKAISDPIRSRILGIIQNQPATAKQIADRLGASSGGNWSPSTRSRSGRAGPGGGSPHHARHCRKLLYAHGSHFRL